MVKFAMANGTMHDEIALFLTNEMTDWWSSQAIIQTLSQDSTYCYVAQYGDKIIAVAMYAVVFETADLLMIAVTSAWRRKHVADELWRFSQDALRSQSVTRVLLEVRQSNTTAKLFYESCGFLVLSIRDNYYSNPSEDGIVMHIELQSTLG